MTPQEAYDAIKAEFDSLNLIAEVRKTNQVPLNNKGWHFWRWSISLRYNCIGPSDTITLSYKQGIGITEPPCPAVVLADYCRDWVAAQEPFETWADNYGLDSDSRAAERDWQSCRNCLPHGFLSTETRQKLAELAYYL